MLLAGGSGDRMELDGQGMGGGEMGYCPWLVSCTLIRLDARTRWDSAKWVARRLLSSMCPG